MDQSHATMVLSLVALFMMVSSPEVVVASYLKCPPNFQIEFERKSILKCDISEGHGDIYWFRGTDTAVVPLLWLESNGPGGKEYGKSEYNITSEGLLVIIDPQLHHEGKYTIRVYFPGESPKTATMMINVFIMPEPLCPTISLCHSDCDECQDINGTSGEISCTINGARPKTNITWDVIDQSGVSSSIDRPVYRHEEVTDTWNSSVSITYTIDICGGFAVFQCNASSTVRLLNPVRNITVSSPVTCDMPTSTKIPESEPFPVFVIVLIIGVVVIILLLILCLLHYYRKDYRRNDVPYTDVPLEPTGKVEPLSEGEKKELISDGLSEFYKKYLYVKPLPWDEPVRINSLYTPCECEIKSEKGGTSTTTSEELFSGDFSFDYKRALIVADLGYGKTTLTKHVVERWISKKDDSILVYIHLKDVKSSTALCDVVLKMLPGDTGITPDDINHILEANKCHFLLDGLDEMSMSLKNQEEKTIHKSSALNKETRERSSDGIEAGVTVQNPERDNLEKIRLTIENLLNGQIPKSFKNDFVWVTSRETDDTKNPFALPFARVKLTGFNADQLQEYITKACKYYIQLRGVDVLTESAVVDLSKQNNKQLETDDAHAAKSANDTGNKEDLESEQNRFEARVRTSLDMNDIANEFSDTPLLLILVIHIIASKIAFPTGKTREVNISKLTTIVRMVISCLESRYVQKMGKKLSKGTISAVEKALGHVAFTQKMGVTLMGKEKWDALIGDEFRDIALAIGLLRLSKNVGKGAAQIAELGFSSYTGVEFYHQYFQEFLAAQYVPVGEEEKGMFEKYLKSCTDEKTLRLLRFMTGSNSERTREVLRRLTGEQKLWNNLIDCMFEDEDDKRVKEMIEQISKDNKKLARNPNINVTNLQLRYHRAAFANFCTLCREHEIPIGMITFREDCAISFLGECHLPSLDRLTFFKMEVTEGQFVRTIENLSKQRELPKHIQFVTCQTPDTFSEDSKTCIKSALATEATGGTEITRKKKKHLAGPTGFYIQKFNTKKCEWEIKWFPEGE